MPRKFIPIVLVGLCAPLTVAWVAMLGWAVAAVSQLLN